MMWSMTLKALTLITFLGTFTLRSVDAQGIRGVVGGAGGAGAGGSGGVGDRNNDSFERRMLATTDADQDDLVCHLANGHNSIKRKLVVVFAMARSGSNKFMEMMENIKHATPRDYIDFICCSELFLVPDKSVYWGMTPALTAALAECSPPFDFPKDDNWREWNYKFRDRSLGNEEFYNRMNLFNITREFTNRFEERVKNPRALLNYLRNVPSPAPEKSFMTLKVFPLHLEDMGMTPKQFLSMLLEMWPVKDLYIMVNWRKNFMDSMISQKLAENAGEDAYVGVAHTEKDAVTLSKESIEDYLVYYSEYLLSVREAIDDLKLPFYEFEYTRNLADKELQDKTREHLLQIFDVDTPQVREALANKVRASFYKKQSKAPVEKMVKNWDEVVQWGYSGGTFEDFFDPNYTPKPLNLPGRSMNPNQPSPDFVCPLKYGTPYKRKLMLVLSTPMAGSSTFVDAVSSIHYGTSHKVMDFINTGELFLSPDKGVIKSHFPSIAEALSECHAPLDWNTHETWHDWANGFSNPDFTTEQIYARMAESDVTKKFLEAYKQRLMNPQSVLKYLRDVPSQAKDNGFVAISLFPLHLEEMAMNLEEFVSLARQVWPAEDIQVKIIWRQRYLDALVSEKVAEATDWASGVYGPEKAVTLEQNELNWYPEHYGQFYQEARAALDKFDVRYEIFEFSETMSSTSQVVATRERLVKELGIPPSSFDAPKEQPVANDLKFTVSVEQMVRNWPAVQAWGHGHGTFENFFARDYVPKLPAAANSNVAGVPVKSVTPFQGSSDFVCSLKDGSPYKRKLMLVLSTPMAGSSTFVDAVSSIHYGTDDDKVDYINAGELFLNPDKGIMKSHFPSIAEALSECNAPLNWNLDEPWYEWANGFSNPDFTTEDIYARMSKTDVTKRFLDAYKERVMNPKSVLQYLRDVPSKSKDNGYIAISLFPLHLEEMDMDVEEFLSLARQVWPADGIEVKFIWRQRYLDAYVSEKVAEATNWAPGVFGPEKAVTLEQNELNWYPEHYGQFYQEARAAVDKFHIPFEAFEFSQTMSSTAQVLATREKLLQQFHIPFGFFDIPKEQPVANDLKFIVPVEQMIRNWQDVQAWGHAHGTFENFFAPDYVPPVSAAKKENHDVAENSDSGGGQMARPNKGDFLCALREGVPHKRKLLVVFSNARSGSNKFVEMLDDLKFATPRDVFDMINFNELFLIPDKSILTGHTPAVTDALAQCYPESDWPESENYEEWMYGFAGQDDTESVYKRLQKLALTRQYAQVFKERMEKPRPILRYLRDIPTPCRDQGYVTVKILPIHLEFLNQTPRGFLENNVLNVFDKENVRVIVLWRKNYMEALISERRAEMGRNAAMTFKREEIKYYVQQHGEYYRTVRRNLDALGLPYETFEFARDIKDPAGQERTRQRLMKMFNVDPTTVKGQAAGQKVVTIHQSSPPVDQMIENWKDIVDWGYGKSEFDDIFETSKS